MKSRFSKALLLLSPLIAGILFAGLTTSISYPCAPLPDDPRSVCVSHEKALMHPGDLTNNVQHSLLSFSRNFALAFTAATLIGLGFSVAPFKPSALVSQSRRR